MTLKEGDIFTIINKSKIKKDNDFKYFKLKYWDGKKWIARFIKSDDTDWISMSESKIFEMINTNVICSSSFSEILEAIVMEKKNAIEQP